MVTSQPPAMAFIFPGQASQRAGMAAQLLDTEPAARPIFQQAGEILGLDLAEVCTTGSDELLTRTNIAQPALLTTSVAWLAALRARGLAPRMAAGHSLGEFAAWVAAGALEFEPALRLVRRRGEIMDEAVQRNRGGMLAVIGLPDEKVIALCERASRAGVIVAANFNSPGQVVVSGEPDALDRAAELAEAAHGRTLPLRVSGAFHSPLMDDAARAFAGLVAEAPVSSPQIPVVANATAEPVTDEPSARQAMAKQMTSPVLWSASVRRMVADGIGLFVEVGPGRVLTNLIARISADARALRVSTPGGLQTLVEEVKS
jgi:[acyl-carrier-protein] S-malonyltransferase